MHIVRNKKGRATFIVHDWQMVSLEGVDRIQAFSEQSGKWPLVITINGTEYEIGFDTEEAEDRAYYAVLEALGGSPAAEDADYDPSPYQSVYAGKAVPAEAGP